MMSDADRLIVAILEETDGYVSIESDQALRVIRNLGWPAEVRRLREERDHARQLNASIAKRSEQLVKERDRFARWYADECRTSDDFRDGVRAHREEYIGGTSWQKLQANRKLWSLLDNDTEPSPAVEEHRRGGLACGRWPNTEDQP